MNNDINNTQKIIDPPDNEIIIHFGIRTLEYNNIHPLTDILINQNNNGLISIYELVDGLEAIQGVNIKWWEVSCKSKISEEFAMKYADKLFWLEMISNSNSIFSQEFIKNNEFRIDWHFSDVHFITETFIERIGVEEVERKTPHLWDYLSKNDNLTLKFIERYQDKLNWQYLSIGKLSDKFIALFSNNLKGHLGSNIISDAKKRYRKSKLQQINIGIDSSQAKTVHNTNNH